MNKLIIPIVVIAIIVIAIGACFVFNDSGEKGVPQVDSPFGFYGPLELSTYIGDKNIYVRNRDYKTFAKILKEAGANWVYAYQVPIYKGDLDFINAFTEQGFFISGEIPGGFGKLEENLYLPKDLIHYRNSLKDYFQKYKMIKHWQYGDEFDGTYFNDTAENFAVMFRIAYKTLKEVNPQAELVLGKEQLNIFTFLEEPPTPENGELILTAYQSKSPRELMFGLKFLKELKLLEEIEKNPFKDNKYKSNPEISKEEYDLIFEKDNIEQYIDGVILPIEHLEITESQRNKVINNLKQYNLDDKILQWEVDAGSWYGYRFGIMNPPGSIDLSPTLPPEEIDERLGAGDLIKTYIPLFGKKIEKVGYGGYLINSDGSKRLEWFTHKLMTEKLKGFSSAEKLSEGQYKFNFNDKNPIWVLWSPEFSKTITLNVGNIQQVKITKAIPKYDTGKEVTDYSAAFEERAEAVNDGNLTITLDKDPVFVEAK